jgi:ankyrin repeat protein
VKKFVYIFLIVGLAYRSTINSVEPITIGAVSLASWGAVKGYKWHKKRKQIWACFQALKSAASFEAFSDELIKGSCDIYAGEIFRSCCEKNNLSLIKQLAQKEIFLEKLSSTALHDACIAGSRAIVEYCLERGVSIEAVDSKGCTPLMAAIGGAELDRIELLCDTLHTDGGILFEDYPEVMCQKWIDDRAQLQESDDYYEIVQILLTHGALLEAQNDRGFQALHYAVIRGDKKIISLLLGMGASIVAKSKDGLTPFDWAVICDDLQLQIDFLEMQGVLSDKLSFVLKNLERSKDAQRFELYRQAHLEVTSKMVSDKLYLHFVVGMGLEKWVSGLIAQDYDVNHTDMYNHEAPLHFGAYSSRRGLAVYYWNKLFQIDSSDPAIKWGPARQAVKRLLLQPICQEEQHIFKDITSLLLDNGATIDLQNRVGWTALHAAAVVGNLEVVQMLIVRGARLDIKDNVGKTAAEWALEIGHADIVHLLTACERGQQ